MWYLDVNSVKTDFLKLSSPFHINSILKLAPVLSQNSEKMHLVRTFCSSTAKTSTVTPIFYFMILIRAVLPFDEKKIGTNLCSVLWQCYQIVRIELSRGRIARVQFNSSLECKVKTGALKGIFLVRKWISNTFKPNSVRYHMHHRKKSFLFV